MKSTFDKIVTEEIAIELTKKIQENLERIESKSVLERMNSLLEESTKSKNDDKELPLFKNPRFLHTVKMP